MEGRENSGVPLEEQQDRCAEDRSSLLLFGRAPVIEVYYSIGIDLPCHWCLRTKPRLIQKRLLHFSYQKLAELCTNAAKRRESDHRLFRSFPCQEDCGIYHTLN